MNKIELFPVSKYKDTRGYISSLWQAGGITFVEDRLSVSKKNVMRGLHGDNITGKLFIPITGTYKFYARSVLTTDSIYLDDFNSEYGQAVYVPPNYINGHVCLSEDCVMLYKWTHKYMGPEKQYTVIYNDSDLGLNWGTDLILSDRDRNGISFKELKAQYENRIW